MSEWISVKDKLPEKQIDVVFYSDPYEWWTGMFTPKNLGYDNDGFKYHQHWGDDGYHKIKNVTHWMPLPKPPE